VSLMDSRYGNRIFPEERGGLVAGHGFEDFYAAQFEPLVVQLAPYLGDVAEAQDVVQEAFCRAWPRWDRLAGYDDPAAWVRRVAWNLATSRWRRVRTSLRFARRERGVVVDGPGPDRVVLEAALATLPPNHRRAIILHYLVGMSVAEIAGDVGAAEGTVKSWLHRGRAALGSRLATDDEGGDAKWLTRTG
jgi:RNA polymerase sigma-70 factor, ECF subfamily